MVLISEATMLQVREALPLERQLRILDVGASNIVGGEVPAYEPLLRQGLGRLTAFEPNPVEYAKLVQGEERQYLPFAIGDGENQPFYVTVSPGLCSTLRPDNELVSHLRVLNRMSKVVTLESIATKKLDDIEGLDGIDLLKIDIQGGEKKAFEGGRNCLSDILCVQTEVAFTAIYKDQPLFGEQDAILKELGLRFYGMVSINRFPMIGLPRSAQRRWRQRDIGQWIDGDALYIRDFMQWHDLSSEKLRRLLFILLYCYPAISAILSICQLLVSRGELTPELHKRLEAELVD